MHILITGSTGMIGNLVLNNCLHDPAVSKVTSVVRRPQRQHAKLTEIIKQDFSDWQDVDLASVDKVVFCLGAYTGNVATDELKRITYQIPADLADALIAANPNAGFVLLSGQGADRKEKSFMAFAKFKGMIENHIDNLGFSQFTSFRPSYIYPVTPRHEPNFSYRLSRKIYPLLKKLGTNYSVTSVQLADAITSAAINGDSRTIIENRDIVHYQRAA